MNKVIKRNIIWCILIVGLLIAVLRKDKSIEIPIVSEPDSQISFTTGSILEQTWQSNVKKINQIDIPYIAETDFETRIKLEFLDDDGTTLLAESEIERSFFAGESGNLTFLFKTFKVIPGVRYKIRAQFSNNSVEGNMLVASGRNYAGCSIDGILQDEAAAFRMTGVKTGRISWLILVFFPFFTFALLLMIVWNRKWEETIGISVILTGNIMLIAGLFGILETGIYIIYLLAIISLLMVIYLYNKKGLEIKDIFSLGMILYVISILVILVNCNQLYLARPDEFSHWGLMAKDMFYYNSLPKHWNSTILLTYYPPFMAVIEYYFTYINGFFSDSFCYVGYQVVLLSCLIIICKNVNKRNKIIVPGFLAVIAVLLMFYEEAFSTLMVDTALAVLTAYTLICYFSEKRSIFNVLRILGGLSALVFTKPTGVILAGLITLIMIGDNLFKWCRERKKVLRNLVVSGICTIFVCLLYLIWQIYLSTPVKAEPLPITMVNEGVEQEEQVYINITNASGITIEKVKNLFLGQGQEYQYETISRYIQKVLNGNSFKIKNFEFSYLDLLLLMLVISWLGSQLIKNEENENNLFYFGILCTFAGLGYAAFLLVTYLFTFSVSDALALAHHERYLASWIGGVLIALWALIFMKATEEEKSSSNVIGRCLICMSIVLIVMSPRDQLLERKADTMHIEEHWYGYMDMLEVFRSVANRAETVYLICNETGGMDYIMMQDVMCPLFVKQFPTDNAMTIQEWGEQLKDTQYVLILHADNEFKKLYRELFEVPETINDGVIYQVVMNDAGLYLHYIGETGAGLYHQ